MIARWFLETLGFYHIILEQIYSFKKIFAKWKIKYKFLENTFRSYKYASQNLIYQSYVRNLTWKKTEYLKILNIIPSLVVHSKVFWYCLLVYHKHE